MAFIVWIQAVPTSKGQALADEYGIKFFETVSSVFTFYFCYVLLTSVLTEWNDLLDMWFPKRLKLYACASWLLFLQSAKTNLNVEQVFFSIARDIKQRLAESDSKPEVQLQSCSSFWSCLKKTNGLLLQQCCLIIKEFYGFRIARSVLTDLRVVRLQRHKNQLAADREGVTLSQAKGR